MANLDTARKRHSGLHYVGAASYGVPVPDGTVAIQDRRTVTGRYSDIDTLAVAPAAEPDATPIGLRFYTVYRLDLYDEPTVRVYDMARFRLRDGNGYSTVTVHVGGYTGGYNQGY